LEGKLQNIKKLFANLRIFIAHPRKTLEACPQPDYFCQEDGADNEAPPRKPLSKERRFIFGAVFLLTLFGILMVYESSSMYAYKITSDSQYFLIRQVVYFAVSLVLFLLALLVDLDFLRRHNKLFLVLTLVLLALVPVIGRTAGGATRWFKLPGFNLQPSEILKITFLFYAVEYFRRKGVLLRSFYGGLLPLGLVMVVICGLLLLQPDLGTAVFWIVWTMLFLVLYRARAKHIVPLVVLALIALFFLIKLHPYRFRRITAYLNPFADPQGTGFQLVQSQIAFGNGGLTGVGLGEGMQKLFFLPAAHTDFIFSIIAEEFGFFGSFAVLALCFTIFYKMFNIARFAVSESRRAILLGITFIFFLEILGNIGVACGLFPTKGLSFPFLSYGGSNLIAHYILLGLFFNASRPYEEKIREVAGKMEPMLAD